MVTGEEQSSNVSARADWATLHAAGFVVICQQPSLGIEERLKLKAAAGERFFDLAEMNLPAGDEEAVAQVLFFIESLRIPSGAENPRKVV